MKRGRFPLWLNLQRIRAIRRYGDGQTKDGGDNELHDAILKNPAIDFETQTTDEENARILFRRLRTIAIGEENMDTIFICQKTKRR